MEISEVSTGPGSKGKRRFSSNVVEAAEHYLAERGVSKDDLSEKQWQFVGRFIKGKQYAKRGLMLMCVGTVISMLMAFGTYKVFRKSAVQLQRIMPTHEVMVRNDGTQRVIESDRGIVKAYGRLHGLMGFVIGFFIFLGISQFSFAVRFIVQMRLRDSVLEAFLPRTESNSISEL